MTVDYDKYQDDPEFKEFQEAKEAKAKQVQVQKFIDTSPVNKMMWEDGGLKEAYDRNNNIFDNQEVFDAYAEAAKMRLQSIRGHATGQPAPQTDQTPEANEETIPHLSGGAAPAGPDTFSLHDRNVDAAYLQKNVKYSDGRTMSKGDAIFAMAIKAK